MIIDSDANCEGDDQIAIIHALMSDKIEVVGIIAEHYGGFESNGAGDSMIQSSLEIKNILSLAGREEIPVLLGSSESLENESKPILSEGAKFIIQECEKEDERPLYIIGQGPLTTLASALITSEVVADKSLLISVGGVNYPYGGFEFNFQNDLVAADLVMKSKIDVWLIPEEAYSTMQVGFYELFQKVHPCGEIGKYLTEHLLEVQDRLIEKIRLFERGKIHEKSVNFPNGESWSLGDSCGVGLILCAKAGDYDVVTAPEINADGSYEIKEGGKQIRLYKSVDSRFILEDFYAKLMYFYG